VAEVTQPDDGCDIFLRNVSHTRSTWRHIQEDGILRVLKFTALEECNHRDGQGSTVFESEQCFKAKFKYFIIASLPTTSRELQRALFINITK
jgi:hypothetical protein